MVNWARAFPRPFGIRLSRATTPRKGDSTTTCVEAPHRVTGCDGALVRPSRIFEDSSRPCSQGHPFLLRAATCSSNPNALAGRSTRNNGCSCSEGTSSRRRYATACRYVGSSSGYSSRQSSNRRSDGRGYSSTHGRCWRGTLSDRSSKKSAATEGYQTNGANIIHWLPLAR